MFIPDPNDRDAVAAQHPELRLSREGDAPVLLTALLGVPIHQDDTLVGILEIAGDLWEPAEDGQLSDEDAEALAILVDALAKAMRLAPRGATDELSGPFVPLVERGELAADVLKEFQELAEGMRTLRQDGIVKPLHGDTDLTQVWLATSD